jgi:hypothetical protein
MKERLASRLGLKMTDCLPMTQDTAIDTRTLHAFLARSPAPREELRLVLLTEAWQPPLRETLDWLAGLRRVAGPHTGLIVGLVGKPEPGNRFTTPAPIDRKIWEQAAGSLKDPFIRVENLGDNHG